MTKSKDFMEHLWLTSRPIELRIARLAIHFWTFLISPSLRPLCFKWKMLWELMLVLQPNSNRFLCNVKQEWASMTSMLSSPKMSMIQHINGLKRHLPLIIKLVWNWPFMPGQCKVQSLKWWDRIAYLDKLPRTSTWLFLTMSNRSWRINPACKKSRFFLEMIMAIPQPCTGRWKRPECLPGIALSPLQHMSWTMVGGFLSQSQSTIQITRLQKRSFEWRCTLPAIVTKRVMIWDILNSPGSTWRDGSQRD